MDDTINVFKRKEYAVFEELLSEIDSNNLLFLFAAKTLTVIRRNFDILWLFGGLQD
jgi:hypothetical protein